MYFYSCHLGWISEALGSQLLFTLSTTKSPFREWNVTMLQCAAPMTASFPLSALLSWWWCDGWNQCWQMKISRRLHLCETCGQLLWTEVLKRLFHTPCLFTQWWLKWLPSSLPRDSWLKRLKTKWRLWRWNSSSRRRSQKLWCKMNWVQEDPFYKVITRLRA